MFHSQDFGGCLKKMQELNENPSFPWKRIQVLRDIFIHNPKTSGDYWTDPEILNAYDQSLGQRIQWKWASVLKKLNLSMIEPIILLDWGCGTGTATQALIDSGSIKIQKILLYDRSPQALAYAKAKFENQGFVVEIVSKPLTCDLLLISHVATELNSPQLKEVLHWIRQSQTWIWVEPGTYAESRFLITQRESLKKDWELLGPCPHSNACGLLAPLNQKHWCHFFAEPRREIFQNAFWSKLHQELKIDIRSLPYSFLAMSKKFRRKDNEPSIILGRPKKEKGRTLYLECDPEKVFQKQILNKSRASAR